MAVDTRIGLPGAGGGGGFTLGPEQNTFTGADRAAAESARDTYFTANPSNLAEYDADSSLNILLTYTDSGDSVALYQIRQGSEWRDNSSATGVAGPPGMGSIDPGIPDGSILRKMTVGGQAVAVASSMIEADEAIDSAKSVTVPPSSVDVGGVRISEAGNALSLTNLSRDITYLAQGVEYDDNGTVSTNNTPVLGALVALPSSTVDTDTFTGSMLGFAVSSPAQPNAPDGALIKDIVLRFAASTPNFNIKIFTGSDNTGSMIIDQSFDAVAGDNTVVYDNNPRFLPDTTYFIQYTSDTDFQILGDNSGPQFIPYNTSRGWPYFEVTATSDATVVPQIEAKAGDERLSYLSLKNRPTDFIAVPASVLIDTEGEYEVYSNKILIHSGNGATVDVNPSTLFTAGDQMTLVNAGESDVFDFRALDSSSGLNPIVRVRKGDAATVVYTGGTEWVVTAGSTSEETIADVTVETLSAGNNVMLSRDPMTGVLTISASGGGTIAPSPSISSLSIFELDTNVEAGTTITGSRTFNYNVVNPNLVQGTLTLSQGSDVLLTNVDPALSSTNAVVTDVTLAAGEHVTFTLSGVSTSSMPFSRSLTIRAPEANENAYWGIRSSNDFATTDLANLTAVDITVNRSFDVTGAFADGSFIGVLVPENMDVSRITTFSTPVTDTFTRLANARTIGTTEYVLYTLENAGGIDGSAAYTVEVR